MRKRLEDEKGWQEAELTAVKRLAYGQAICGCSPKR